MRFLGEILSNTSPKELKGILSSKLPFQKLRKSKGMGETVTDACWQDIQAKSNWMKEARGRNSES